MSEENTTPEAEFNPHRSEAPADATNVIPVDFGSAPEPAEPQAQVGAPYSEPEQPLSGTGLPPAYVKALEKANTHLIFGEIQNHVANFGYTILSGYRALEHLLLRDQSIHADASVAWARVKEALKQAGAEFKDEEAVIDAWFKHSNPVPPIVVQPQAGVEAVDSPAEPSSETTASAPVETAPEAPVVEAPVETPVEPAAETATEVVP